MVLVPGQSGTPSERLLAIGIRALVGSLAGMNSAVPGQGAAVTEGLATSLTPVRLLASMYARVNGQGGPLDELLATPRIVANMGPNATVDPLCLRVNDGEQGMTRHECTYHALPGRCA